MSFTNTQFLFCGHMQWNTFKMCFKVLGGIRMALFFVLKLYIFKQNFILKEQKKERGGGGGGK